MHVHERICIYYACIYTYIYVYIYIYISIYMYVCIYIFVHTHVTAYLCTADKLKGLARTACGAIAQAEPLEPAPADGDTVRRRQGAYWPFMSVFSSSFFYSHFF